MPVLALAAALTLSLTPAEAPGPAGPIELRWTAPAGCPEAEHARALVERLVPGTGASARVDATIDAVQGGFSGTLELHGEPTGIVRRLAADDCLVLARAMAVVIAVSLDPLAVAESRRNSAVPEPVPPPEGERDRPRASTADAEPPGTGPAREGTLAPANERVAVGDRIVAEPRPARRELELGVGLGAGVGGLLLPAAGMGLSLAPFLGTARVHVRAVAQYWAPQRVAFDPPRDASGELQLVTGGVRLCPQLGAGLGWTRVRIPVCAGVDAGAILGRGTGRDLAAEHTAREPWVGAVLEPGVTVGVTSRVSLWLALEGVVSLYRPLFAIGGAPEPWTAGAGAVRGLFGVQVHARRKGPQNP